MGHEDPIRIDFLQLLALRQQLPDEIGERLDELMQLLADAQPLVRGSAFDMLSDINSLPMNACGLHSRRIEQLITYLRNQKIKVACGNRVG